MTLTKLLRNRLIIESQDNRIPMNITIPNDIKAIHKVFKANGKELFVVGGSIRDALLKKIPKDWDLATDALPDDVIRMLKSQSFITNIIETGKAFGVINAFTANDEYEIATFRADIGSSDGRRPDSVEFTDIATDVMRRDLTINALFYDLDTNEVVDLVGGVEDLKNGIVRTVGNASERFDEDQLRVLRAIRFAGRFGSNVDADIDKVLSGGIDMSNISGERIRDEFIKGIKTSKSTKHFLGLLDKYNLFEAIFPNLNVSGRFLESNDPDLAIAALLNGNANVAKTLNSLKYPSDQINNIEFLLGLLSFTDEDIINTTKKRSIVNLSDEQIMEFTNTFGMNTSLVEKILNFRLTVNGNEVMDKFGVKGAELGKKIKELEISNFRASLK